MIPDFKTLIQEAARKRFPLQAQTNAFRVFNGGTDGLEGLTIDRYAEHWQIQFFDRTWFWCETQICDAVMDLFHPSFLVVKERLDPSGKSLQNPVIRVMSGEQGSGFTWVKEGAAQFGVDLLDTVNPGLFLDMRENRLAVAGLASGGEMLNLFCYTGSFSVHGRLAGAIRAVNVDVSGKILDRVKLNYERNGIAPVKGEFFKGDSEDYLQYANRKGMKFKLVVLDPPSFSRSDRGIFQAKNHLSGLVRLCAPLIEDGGCLFVSTNLSEVSQANLATQAIESVHSLGLKAEVVWTKGQGSDFPGTGSVKESCLSALLLKF